jgi:hypothetical protein
MINTGFITPSFTAGERPVDIGRGRGVKTGKPFGSSGTEIHATTKQVGGPGFYLLRAIKTKA